MKVTKEMLDVINKTAVHAGLAIMKIYREYLEVSKGEAQCSADGGRNTGKTGDAAQQAIQLEYKDGKMPLTAADKASNAVIVESLRKNFPECAVLSEEEKDDLSRLDNPYCFVVDPLDGTKEFIKRNGQFTVNIALAENHTSVLGVIYVPVSGELYYAAKGMGAKLVTLDAEKLQEIYESEIRGEERISKEGEISKEEGISIEEKISIEGEISKEEGISIEERISKEGEISKEEGISIEERISKEGEISREEGISGKEGISKEGGQPKEAGAIEGKEERTRRIEKAVEEELSRLTPSDLHVSDRREDLRVVMSSSHGCEEMNRLLEKYNLTNFVKMGSSLKGCVIAKGEAEVYYRHNPTMEWDTAAMQCIVEEAGAIFRQMDDTKMCYNREDSLNAKGFYIINCEDNKLV